MIQVNFIKVMVNYGSIFNMKFSIEYYDKIGEKANKS